jgi:hypothetical protein
MIIRFVTLFSLLALLTSGAAAQQQIPRQLAPGVLTVIPSEPKEDETASPPGPLVEMVANYAGLDWKPNYMAKKETLLEKSKYVTLRRPIWNLEFAFKPVRRITVDMPQTSGKMQQKQIWYMVYRVKNMGTQFVPTGVPDAFGKETYKVEPAPRADIRFIPHFVFAGKAQIDDEYVDKEYLDRILPIASKAIESRESRNVKLYNSVEITQVPIPVSDENVDRSVWGYVTWEDIDPRIDFFSIYVQGLTNAYRYSDPPNGYEAGKAPGSGRLFAAKTLQLNFWRAGDSIAEHEEEVHYGIRLEQDPVEQSLILSHYGLTEPLDHRWIYR